MSTRSKESWLRPGAGDLKEAEVEDVPVDGESVRVRGLPAAYSNEAQSEAMETRLEGREQVARINTGKLEVLQFVHGVVDPVFTIAEAEQIAKTHGPAWRRVIDKIDELSAIDKKAIKETEARFPAGGASEGGSGVGGGNSTGNGEPAVRARAGA